MVLFLLASKLEESFPLAFGHNFHKEAGLLELQLATLIRPHDAHCFHIDPKSTYEERAAVESIVACYQQRFPESTNIIDEVIFLISSYYLFQL